MRKNRKAQGWGMDLIIAVTIFSLGLVAFYVYSLNANESKEVLETLSYNGKIMANTILSEGYPPTWDTGDVVKIGILSNGRINDTKLEYFYNMTETEESYQNSKPLFDTTYDYYFYLSESMDINGGIDGIGKPGFDRNNIPEDVKNLVKITRYTIYKNKPMTAYLYIWNE